MVTARARNQLREDYAMFEGPAMVVLWLMAPAFVGIASFGAGLALDAMSKLWACRMKSVAGGFRSDQTIRRA